MQSTLKTFSISLVAVSSLLIGSQVAMAADAEKGKNLYTEKLCQTCHGPDANTPLGPGYPKLAGQDETYIANQIIAIRDQKRTNSLSAAMLGFTIGLTDENIADLAAWIASVKPSQ
jgi:cytochrome c